MLKGILPVLPTIFGSGGEIDERGTRAVLDYAVAAGAAGIVYPGLASEYDCLRFEERVHMSARVGEWLDGRVPFIIGASADDPAEVVPLVRAGAAAGAGTAMILTPKAFSGDKAAMAAFYADVHAQTGVAIMLQNAPAPMGLGFALEGVADMARAVTGIRYVKEEAPPSGQRITRLTDLAGDALDAVFGGAGARHLIDELRRGARGSMPAVEITELHVEMVRRFDAGDEDGARDLFERTLPLLSMQAVFRWRLTKAVLQRRGLIEHDHVRAPGATLDRHDRRELATLLDRLADLLPFVDASAANQGGAALTASADKALSRL